MIKKTIYIGNPARLSLRHGQMLIEKPEELVHNTIPVEDTGILILDHSQITLTHGLMEELVENNAAILFCNNKHMPHGLVLPMDTHSTFSQNIKCQIEASEPLKKQLWKQTVEAKIKNQIALLKKLGKVSARMEYLHKNVQSGDKTNAEKNNCFMLLLYTCFALQIYLCIKSML